MILTLGGSKVHEEVCDGKARCNTTKYYSVDHTSHWEELRRGSRWFINYLPAQATDMLQILNCLISRQDFKGAALERKPEHTYNQGILTCK